MKHFLIFFALIATNIQLFAQFKTAEIQLEEKGYLDEMYPFKEGVILFTHDGKITKSVKKLYIYSTVGNLLKEIPISQTHYSNRWYFTKSHSEKMFYMRQFGIRPTDKDVRITRFNTEEVFEEYDVRVENDFVVDLEMEFADDQNIYWVRHDKQYEKNSIENRGFNKILIKANSNGVVQFPLVFPDLRHEVFSSEWYYAWNSEGEIAFMSKTITPEKKYIIDFFVTDTNGKELRKFSVDIDLNKFVHAADNFTEKPFGSKRHPERVLTTSGYYSQVKMGAHGGVYFDQTRKNVYIFGLTGSEFCGSPGPKDMKNEGFFICKYNSKGAEIEKKEFSLPEGLLQDDRLVSGSKYERREVRFKLNTDKSMQFEVRAANIRYIFTISENLDHTNHYTFESDGKEVYQVENYKREFDPKIESAAKNFLEKNSIPVNSKKYSLYVWNNSFVIIKGNENGKVNSYFFKKE